MKKCRNEVIINFKLQTSNFKLHSDTDDKNSHGGNFISDGQHFADEPSGRTDEADVGLDGLRNLAEQDELVGTMAARRLAGTQLQRGEGHQRLVAQRGRPEGRHAHLHTTLHQGVVGGDAGRRQAEGARRELAPLHVLPQEVEEVLVFVKFVGAHVDDEAALVGDDVVLRAAVEDGHRHLGGAEQRTLLAETVVAQPHEVVQGLVDGVDTFVAGGMAALAVRHAVDDHESLLGHGGLHARGLAHDGHVNLRQLGQGQRKAASTADLLLAGGEVDQVVRRGRTPERAVGGQQAHQSAAAVVAAQAVEGVALDGGAEGVARPCADGLHRVDVGVEQQGGLPGV